MTFSGAVASAGFAAILLSASSAGIALAASAPELRFYPVESFTIVSVLDGMRKGTKTVHVRNWGRSRVEIEKTAMSVFGITQTEDKRVITEGAEITTIDEKTKTVTKTTNPMYANIARGMQGKDGPETGRNFMTALGHRQTGGTGNYGGESCEIWTNAQLGQELCATRDGLVLRMATSLGNIAMTETATSVRRGDPGPASAYQVPNYPVQQGPNLQDLLNRARRPR